MTAKKWGHILSLLLVSASVRSQNGITGCPDWQIKPVYNEGFVLVHRISIGHLVKGYPSIYEINVSKTVMGNKLWHLENNFPDLGITLQCIDFRNAQQLGYAYSIAPYMEIPLSAEDRWWRVHMRLCWGLTYITRAFDIESNHKNIAIGSHWNVYAQFRWFWQMKLSQHFRFEPGITFSHTSNGRMQNPNLGLNVVSLSAALNYLIPEKCTRIDGPPDSSSRTRARNEFIIFAAAGANQRSTHGPLLPTRVVSAAVQRNIRNTHKFSLGIDIFDDQNYREDYRAELKKEAGFSDGLRMAARIGYSYNVGRISFPIEAGYYFFRKVDPDGAIVSRIGVRYFGPRGFIGHFGLRTHFAVAYNFEFGVGYRVYFGR